MTLAAHSDGPWNSGTGSSPATGDRPVGEDDRRSGAADQGRGPKVEGSRGIERVEVGPLHEP